MGRITIFSVGDCPHCIRAKLALGERNLPYTEISLTQFPHRRNDMLRLTDRLTLPQVFFNSQHIGGADETIQRLKAWKDDTFETEIASQDDPTDPRLQPPPKDAVPRTPRLAPPRPHEQSILLPDKTFASVLQVTERLRPILSGRTLKYRLKIYRNAVVGSDAVRAIMDEFQIDKEQAVEFGKTLQTHQILHHVCDDHEFGDYGCYYYRLHLYHTPSVLNSYRVWTERVDPNSVALIRRLKQSLSKVLSAVTDADGRVDYKAARQHEAYPVFEEAVCELQGVDLMNMDSDTKLAFCINLYNLMIQYAFCKVGVPVQARMSFFNNVKCNVGGHCLSFQDLEHGILRGNRKAPYTLSRQFDAKDKRLPLAMEELDCRIHFAVNCGAKSCPPIKNFSAEGIHEELRIVAMAFCELDENVRVDTEHRTVYLSKILYWFRSDFAKSNEELPSKILEFLRGEKKATLERLLADGKQRVQVKFNPYDWSTNASDFESFDNDMLKPDMVSLNALVPDSISRAFPDCVQTSIATSPKVQTV